jgi:hypothetical protein
MTDRRKVSIVTVLIVFIIFLLLLIICGIAAFFLFFRSPPKEGMQIARVYEQMDALASKKLSNGLVLELIDAVRQKDGLAELKWRYCNPTPNKIMLCSNDEGKRLRDSVYCEYAGEKYYPYKFSDNKLISDIGWVDVETGKTRMFWARFDVTVDEKDPIISLSIPGLLLPFEDIKLREPDDKKEGITETAPPTEKHSTGLTVSVSRVKKSSGRLVEVRWEYSNPTDKPILLFSTDTAESLPSQIYLENNSSRKIQGVHRDSKGIPSASVLPFTVVKPKETVNVFAKFPVEINDNDTLTFYLPDTPPIPVAIELRGR